MGEALYEGENMTSPNGAYITEVEVDPETGGVRLEEVTIVNDLGRVLNAQFAEGQIHGGVAQAFGQAMMEEVRYDPQSGQLLSGSLMDYGIPRADDLPMLNAYRCDIPSLNNPHGYKGAGEIAAIGGCAAYINAVINALGTAIDMPATPLRVWKALNKSK
jgi:carbon-monoxide dehydrogenase large subunit